MFEDLDELARGLAENDISRRQAIKWAGYSVLGAALSSMGFAEPAEALGRRQRRKCRRKGGTPLEKGECHCGYRCEFASPGPPADRFVCENNPSCACVKTTEGRGFCADIRAGSSGPLCSRSSQCPSGMRCARYMPSGSDCLRGVFGNPLAVCARACRPPTTSSTQQDAASRVS